MEATLQHCTGRSETLQKDKAQANQERKKQVQRNIKKHMSALVMPDHYSNIGSRLSSVNPNSCDLESFSKNLKRDISHGEFQRLVTSAANLIIATTPERPSTFPYQQKDASRKADVGYPRPSTCVKKSPYMAQTSALNEESNTHCDENVYGGYAKLQAIHSDASQVAGKIKNIDYKVTAHIEGISPPEATPSLYIRLVGVHGRSKKLLLSRTVYHGKFNAKQAICSIVKAKDVGELNQVMIGVNIKNQGCRCYCTRISLSEGRTEYMFPCNKWLSHQMISVYATKHNPSVKQPQAPTTGPENHQMQTKTSKLSADNSNPHVVSTDTTNLNSSASTGKEKLSNKGDSKEKTVSRISKTNTYLPKKVPAKDLDIPQTSNAKPIGFYKKHKCKSSKRKCVFSKRNLQNIPDYEETAELGLGDESGEDQRKMDQASMPEDKWSNIMEDDSIASKALLNTNDTITEGNATTTDINIPTQNKVQTELEDRRASSPASYLFFSHEIKETPRIIKVHSEDKSNFPINHGSTNTYTDHHCIKGRSGCHSSGDHKESSEDRNSQLNLLQHILDSEGGVTDYVSGAHFQPSSNDMVIQEKIEDQYEKSAGANPLQISGSNGPFYQGDNEGIHTSGCCCSCEDCSSYETDSSLNEEYLFSDSSLALSVSEEEGQHCLKSMIWDKNRKKSSRQVRQVNPIQQDIRNSNILFQRSLAAVRRCDVRTVRRLFQAHFFLPSITDEEGKTILHHAAVQENEDICQVLLETSVGMITIDQKDMFGKTALHYAVENGSTKTIKLLLDKGATMEITDRKSKTVLDICL